ncbi:MAG: hypothetical protein WCJ70_03820 [bacterium]
MNPKLAKFIFLQRLYALTEQIMYPVIAVVLLILLAFQLYGIYTISLERFVITERLDALNETHNQITGKRSLPIAERDTYSAALLKLIPLTEDIFQITSTINALAADTDMKIDQFSPPREADVKKGTTQVSVNISGTTTAFENFLQKYQYLSGRFMTLSSVRVSYKDGTVTAQLTLVFYTAPIPKDKTELTGLRDPQRKLLTTIKPYLEKLGSAGIIDDSETVDVDYPTAGSF